MRKNSCIFYKSVYTITIDIDIQICSSSEPGQWGLNMALNFVAKNRKKNRKRGFNHDCYRN